MNIIIKRNIKLFFRDKSEVFFSLLSVFIIIALYAVFLGDAWISDEMKKIENAREIMNDWLIAGLLSVASVTTTMGAFGVMIDDKTRKIDKDFYSSPIKASKITFGYIGSSFLIGVIMSVITLVVGELYIMLSGGKLISPVAILKALLLILLTTVTNTSIICFLVSFFQSQNAFGTASTVIGTLIGFLTGIYLPVGTLPEWVQTIIKIFPVSHAAALFRQLLMEDAINTGFSGIPQSYIVDFKEYMGVVFRFGSCNVSAELSILILLITAAVFCALSIISMSKRHE